MGPVHGGENRAAVFPGLTAQQEGEEGTVISQLEFFFSPWGGGIEFVALRVILVNDPQSGKWDHFWLRKREGDWTWLSFLQSKQASVFLSGFCWWWWFCLKNTDFLYLSA